MKIKVFAHLAEALGDEIELDLPQRADRATLLQLIADKYPLQATTIKHCNVAVDHSYIYDESVVLTKSSEIAVIPPVSGG